jgi:hypothetical protein
MLAIKRIHEDFSLCKVKAYSSESLDFAYCFIGSTPEEKSLVCLTKDVPEDALSAEDGWRMFRLEADHDQSMISSLAKISSQMDDAKEAVMFLSTYDGEYILLRKEKENEALEKLSEAGWQII